MSLPSPPGTLAFADAWRDHVEHRAARLDEQTDLAFWRAFAARYDQHTAQPGSYDQTLTTLLELIPPGATVLDAGAGTGRFAVPLAVHGRCITAVDHAQPMIDILRRKAETRGVGERITTVVSPFETIDVDPHDVVLAAWALYRQADLRRDLARLAGLARSQLILVVGDCDMPPHRRAVRGIWKRDGEPEVPAYLYVLGALRELGLRAELKIVYEQRDFEFSSALAAARFFAPAGAGEGALLLLADRLSSHLRRLPAGTLGYSHAVAACVIHWRRTAHSVVVADAGAGAAPSVGGPDHPDHAS